MSQQPAMEFRPIHETRRFATFAVIEKRHGRDPLRTEIVRNNKTDSYFCRACKSADVCRHVAAARRLVNRPNLALVP